MTYATEQRSIEISKLSPEAALSILEKECAPKMINAMCIATSGRSEIILYNGLPIKAEGRSTVGRKAENGRHRDRVGQGYATYYTFNGKTIAKADLLKKMELAKELFS